MTSLLTLFFVCFGAATLLPGGSEFLLGTMVVDKGYAIWVLIAVATAGNTLGSVVNWGIGFFLAGYADRRWFPLSATQYAKYSAWYRKWGIWSLLLSWAPVVGDPLTVVAGLMRANLLAFFIIVAIAKGFRYLAVATGVSTAL